MDYDSSSKFISSLAKFLQSLCNGYVEFDNGVQVIGHLYLSVDTGTTIDYILNEKVCKTDENSVTFISNSFHAQPAEKPKPQGRRTAKESDKTESKNEENVESNVGSQAELRSTNIGTLPASHNSHGAKRPYSPSQKQSSSKSGRSSPRHKRSRTESLDQNIQSQASNPASENSISSAPSPAADGISSNITTAQSSDDAPYGDSYQQSFFNPDEENSMADESEERDIKPSIDTDVTFIKEEFAPSSSCAQSSSQNRDRSHGEDSSVFPYQSNQVFPGAFSGGGGFGASGSQRSNFSAAGDRSSHLFSAGQSSSQIEGGENSGDPSASLHIFQRTATGIPRIHRHFHPQREGGRYKCDNCGKTYTLSHVLTRHKWKCKGLRVIRCTECQASFHRMDHLKKHMLRHGIVHI